MTPSWRARIKALSANPGKVRLGDRTAKSVDGEFCIDGTVRHSGEFCGPGPPDRSLPQPESVDRFVTTCRRKAGVVTLLLTVSGCAHGIHPAPPPQLPPPEVPPPQVPPPQVPATQAPERPAARLLFTATAYLHRSDHCVWPPRLERCRRSRSGGLAAGNARSHHGSRVVQRNVLGP